MFFSINCSGCIKQRCRNCFEFNKSKVILINSFDLQISWSVSNFLTDYFCASELSNRFFKINISEEVKEKNPLYIYNEKIFKIFATKKKGQMKKLSTSLREENASIILKSRVCKFLKNLEKKLVFFLCRNG